MKKMISLLLAALAFAAPLSQAQTAPPADPATVAAVQELLVAMNYRDVMEKSFASMETVLPSMMMEMATSMINTDNSLSAKQKAAALEQMPKLLPVALEAVMGAIRDPKLRDEIIAEMGPLYARHFTIAEIRELAAFYKTPLGAKMLAKMPEIMNDSMQLSQKVVMPRLTLALEKFAKATR